MGLLISINTKKFFFNGEEANKKATNT